MLASIAEREQARHGQNGHGQNGQNRKRIVKIRHYNINILFIYSEQMTAFPKSKMTILTLTTLTTILC